MYRKLLIDRLFFAIRIVRCSSQGEAIEILPQYENPADSRVYFHILRTFSGCFWDNAQESMKIFGVPVRIFIKNMKIRTGLPAIIIFRSFVKRRKRAPHLTITSCAPHGLM